jgi:aryl-alcohol dehydrogenase-like predicted oxidoreductase
MKYVEAGGVSLSAIGLGTWQFGSGEWGYGAGYGAVTAPEIVARSLELGVNLLDTAEIYGFGRSEGIVGEAIAGLDPLPFVATKLFPVLPVNPVVARRAQGSLRRLGLEALDLYQVHWKNPLVPVGPTMSAMAALQRRGLVRHVGVSNFSLDGWKAAEAALGGPVLSNQVQFSLTRRKPLADLVPWAQQNDRIVIAYSPLAQGLLSGRYGPDHRPGGMRASTSAFLPENLRRIEPLLGVLREVAAAHDASSAQVALAWVIRRPNVIVIPGASSVAQAESNAAAADLELTDAEDEALLAAAEAFHPLAGPQAASALGRQVAERGLARVRGVREGLKT